MSAILTERALRLIQAQRESTLAGHPTASRRALKRILNEDTLTTLSLSAAELHDRAEGVHPNPTQAQKDAGNYAKARISIKGMPISIEVKKGGFRRGIGKDGQPWQNLMERAHYGYFLGIHGGDKENLDVFVADGTGPGENIDSDIAFVVNQIRPDTGEYDEAKVILGCVTKKAARDVYLSAYRPGWKGIGSIVELTIPQLKSWMESGKTNKALPESAQLVTLSLQPQAPHDPEAGADHETLLLAYMDALVDAENGNPHADQVADEIWHLMHADAPPGEHHPTAPAAQQAKQLANGKPTVNGKPTTLSASVEYTATLSNLTPLAKGSPSPISGRPIRSDKALWNQTSRRIVYGPEPGMGSPKDNTPKLPFEQPAAGQPGQAGSQPGKPQAEPKPQPTPGGIGAKPEQEPKEGTPEKPIPLGDESQDRAPRQTLAEQNADAAKNWEKEDVHPADLPNKLLLHLRDPKSPALRESEFRKLFHQVSGMSQARLVQFRNVWLAKVAEVSGPVAAARKEAMANSLRKAINDHLRGHGKQPEAHQANLFERPAEEGPQPAAPKQPLLKEAEPKRPAQAASSLKTGNPQLDDVLHKINQAGGNPDAVHNVVSGLSDKEQSDLAVAAIKTIPEGKSRQVGDFKITHQYGDIYHVEAKENSQKDVLGNPRSPSPYTESAEEIAKWMSNGGRTPLEAEALGQVLSGAAGGQKQGVPVGGPKADEGPHWSETLGVNKSAGPEEIESAYRAKAREAHPDRGGSAEQMTKLNSAAENARKDVRTRQIFQDFAKHAQSPEQTPQRPAPAAPAASPAPGPQRQPAEPHPENVWRPHGKLHTGEDVWKHGISKKLAVGGPGQHPENPTYDQFHEIGKSHEGTPIWMNQRSGEVREAPAQPGAQAAPAPAQEAPKPAEQPAAQAPEQKPPEQPAETQQQAQPQSPVAAPSKPAKEPTTTQAAQEPEPETAEQAKVDEKGAPAASAPPKEQQEFIEQHAKQLAELQGKLDKAIAAGKPIPAQQGRPENGQIDYDRAYSVPTTSLRVDPERFQYKETHGNKKGVTEKLKDVKHYDTVLGGVLSVWRDPKTGQDYVVNGHHRHDLAERAGRGSVNVLYINADTPEQARAMGALANIAEGNGTAIDAAKFLRDSHMTPEEMKEKHGVSLKGKLAQDGITLSKLADPLFGRLALQRPGDSFDIDRAKALAEFLPDDPAGQAALLADVEKKEAKQKGKLSPGVIEQAARAWAAAPKVEGQPDIFGDTDDRSTYLDQAALKEKVKADLIKERNHFAAVAGEKRAEELGKHGNVLNTEQNKIERKKAEEALDLFDRIAAYKGPLSPIFDEEGVEYARAKTDKQRDAVVRRTVERARAILAGGAAGSSLAANAGGHEGNSAGAGPAPGAEPARDGGAAERESNPEHEGASGEAGAGVAPPQSAPAEEPKPVEKPPASPHPSALPPEQADLSKQIADSFYAQNNDAAGAHRMPIEQRDEINRKAASSQQLYEQLAKLPKEQAKAVWDKAFPPDGPNAHMQENFEKAYASGHPDQIAERAKKAEDDKVWLAEREKRLNAESLERAGNAGKEAAAKSDEQRAAWAKEREELPGYRQAALDKLAGLNLSDKDRDWYHDAIFGARSKESIERKLATAHSRVLSHSRKEDENSVGQPKDTSTASSLATDLRNSLLAGHESDTRGLTEEQQDAERAREGQLEEKLAVMPKEQAQAAWDEAFKGTHLEGGFEKAFARGQKRVERKPKAAAAAAPEQPKAEPSPDVASAFSRVLKNSLGQFTKVGKGKDAPRIARLEGKDRYQAQLADGKTVEGTRAEIERALGGQTTERRMADIPLSKPTGALANLKPEQIDGAFARAWKDQSLTAEQSDGVVELPNLFNQLKHAMPGLTREQFNSQLEKMANDRKLDLMVLNETRRAKPGEGIQKGDNLYYFAKFRKGQADELEKHAPAVEKPAAAKATPKPTGDSGIHQAMADLEKDIETEDGKVSIPRLYHAMRQQNPKLTSDELHDELKRLAASGRVKLHEEPNQRKMLEPHLAANLGDGKKAYYAERTKPDVRQASIPTGQPSAAFPKHANPVQTPDRPVKPQNAPNAKLAPPPNDQPIVPPPTPTKKVHTPDPSLVDPKTGVSAASRVGVLPMQVPPPPAEIPRLPNLVKEERDAETRFAESYLANPDAMVAEYRKKQNNQTGVDDKGNPKYEIGDAPNIFNSDDAKGLSHDYHPPGATPDEQKKAKALFNTAVHQTATAIAKRAFLAYLDDTVAKLPPDKKTVLVTSGGVACHGIDTPILMFDGSIRAVQDVRKDEQVMGPDSTPRAVLRTTRGIGQLYRVIPKRGEPFICNEDHVLSLKTKRTIGSRKRRDLCTANLTIRQVLKRGKTFIRNSWLYRAGADFVGSAVPLDPYFLGIWLGDGHCHQPSITSADHEIVDFLKTFILDFPTLKMKVQAKKDNLASVYHLTLREKRPIGRSKTGRNPIIEILEKLNVRRNKHIPSQYLINSREVRLQLLAGLLDTDGHFGNNCGFEFISKIERMAHEVAFLARSLGFAAYVKEVQKSSQTGYVGTYYRMWISGNVDEIPTRIAKKKAGSRPKLRSNGSPTKNVLQTGYSIEPIGDGDFYGFTLDCDGLYLLGDFTVTHNSGKGYALSSTARGKQMQALAGAVWDATGEANATENPWIFGECKKRGLKMQFAYIHGDADAALGRMISRAGKIGRTVDILPMSDSYAIGPANAHRFHQDHKDDQDCEFIFMDNSGKDPVELPGVPPQSLKENPEHLYGRLSAKMDELAPTLNPDVLRGATRGRGIWMEPGKAS